VESAEPKEDTMSLPDATPQNPSCGCCQAETTFDGDVFSCYDCGLSFDAEDFHGAFTDPDEIACGASCDNWWHGPHRIYPGRGYDCSGCQLPTGHLSPHWTGCMPIAVEEL